MLMSGFLNLGSLLLGLTAWIVPILAIKHSGKHAVNNCFNFIIVSFSACVASLCLQLFEINHRVQIKDWSALMDTIGTLVWVALILAVITLILNIIALDIYCKKEKKA
jgi:cytochrome c oxidase subunit 4